MNYVILSQQVPPKSYSDELGVVYNYPKRYWPRLAKGDRFIYHQPSSSGGGGKTYIGCGLVGEITSDPEDPTRRNAELQDYTEFTKPVPMSNRGQFVEPGILTPANLRGNAVRIVPKETASLIVSRSGTAPPWTWDFFEEPSQDDVDGSPDKDLPPFAPDLRKAIERFDAKYSSMPPEERRRQVAGLHRPSSIGRILKQLYGTKCWVCGEEGFQKRTGNQYAEAHHVEEVHTRVLGVLGSRNIIIVCANCHRKLHYADVDVRGTEAGWEITINGKLYQVYRPVDGESQAQPGCT